MRLLPNYLANTLAGGTYTGGASKMGGKIAYTNNAFRGIVWGYDIITTNMATTVIGLNAFQNAGWPIAAGHHLTSWVATATVPMPMPSVSVSYKKDDIVKHGAAPDLYRAKMDTNVGPPDTHPEVWEKLAKASDDMRVKTAAYPGYGVQ